MVTMLISTTKHTSCLLQNKLVVSTLFFFSLLWNAGKAIFRTAQTILLKCGKMLKALQKSILFVSALWQKICFITVICAWPIMGCGASHTDWHIHTCINHIYDWFTITLPFHTANVKTDSKYKKNKNMFALPTSCCLVREFDALRHPNIG